MISVGVRRALLSALLFGASAPFAKLLLSRGLSPLVLARALEPFAPPVRTLDALHLATMDFLRAQGQTLRLASYDQRLAAAAQALGFGLVDA